MERDIAAILRNRIERRYRGPERDNYLNHVQRYAVSLSWLPDSAERVMELGSGAGLFAEIVREHRPYRLETTNFDFNLEKDCAPYATERFDGVLLMEVLEHFAVDPMFALAEVNRILKPDGFLFLSTPNLASWRALHAAIDYRSPYLFGIFTANASTDRHNREYTVEEVRRLVVAAGFRVERIEALSVYPESATVQPIPGVATENRGDTTFCLCRKEGPIRDRFPDWLYWS
ncbi:MAG TPA: class I SAM-dependent methyltransferase [Chloroflexota bacterium]|nr:class I SAM-dependent methyltransferase [Chloroflexota bacterium]